MRVHSWILGPLLLFSFFTTASIAKAEEISIGLEEGPYYVGEPVLVQVAVKNIRDADSVSCTYDGADQSNFSIVGPKVNQSTQSVTRFDGRRMIRSSSAVYTYNFHVTAMKAGEHRVGPFAVDINGTQQTLRGTTINFEELENDPDMLLEITIGSDTIYAGQRVPVKISWGFAGSRDELQDVFRTLQIKSSLFDQFEFLDERPASQTRLAISSAAGNIEIDAEAIVEARDGRQFVVVTGTRTLIAGNAGVYDAIAATCRVHRFDGVASRRRGGFSLFERARPTRPAIAAAKPISFVVKALPTKGRPESFSGAVGEGFSIEVSANRSVVRVGDPISLDVTLRGDGNLEKLPLPWLTGEGGLDQQMFQLPAERPSGVYSEGSKQFTLPVRVRNASINQIPAIAFSWFDPSREEYQTTYSKPIALQVMETQIVSATDVVSAAETASGVSKGADEQLEASGTTRSISFIGANLAIERDLPLLLGTGSLLSSSWMTASLYVLGMLAIAFALLVRRKANIDPTQAKLRQAFLASRRRIADSRSLASRQAAEAIADALRAIVANYSQSRSDNLEANSVIADCESLVYAPEAKNDPQQVAQLVDRALSAADRLSGKR